MISIDLIGIPNFAIMQYHTSTTFLILVFKDINHTTLDERFFLIFKLQTKNKFFVLFTELGYAAKLEKIFVDNRIRF